MVRELAWQLRSKTLAVENGIVIPYLPMLISANPETLAIVQDRCKAINEILTSANVNPKTIRDVEDYFNRLENGAE